MAVADIKIEQLGSGINTEENSGAIVNSEILIAPISAFTTIATPAKALKDGDATAMEQYVTITANHVFKAGYGFTKIKAIVEKNSYEAKGIGSRGARAEENKLTINIAGSDPELAGWIRRYKNEDLIVLFKTFGRGDYRQIGSLDYAAFIAEKTAKIGETVEGDSMRTIVFADKQLYEAPYYTGTRSLQPAP